MFKIKDEKNKTIKEKIKIFILFLLLFFLTFIMLKVNILPFTMGSIFLILLYVYINFYMMDIFFTSKRTLFKLYLGICLDMLYFLLGSFSLKGILIFLICVFLLSYFIIKDEGKDKKVEVIQFMTSYVVLKIIFILFLISIK